MSNYLRTMEFEDSATMRIVLIAAKLAIDPDVWRKINSDVYVDEDEAVLWTETDNYKPVLKLWDYIYNDFDWSEADMNEPDGSEIEVSEYFEDNAITHDTTTTIDQLVDLPSIEFEHRLYQGSLNNFIGGEHEQVA